MRADSVYFKGHLCFQKEWAGFDTIKPVNVIIGRNNSGKSHLSHLQNSNSTSRAKLMAFDSWQFLALIRCWAACGASPR